MKPEQIAKQLVGDVAALRFAPPVAFVYNPLEYAARSHAEYLRRFASSPKEALLVGMNPGPWGMAQSGVPFGDVAMVRDWMGIEAQIDSPERTHPKRPVEGFACERSEVSGTRLWGWARDRFGDADTFFERFFVWNYCPLSFLEEGGRNRTPDKLPKAEQQPLFEACDRALAALVDTLAPQWVIGVGKFAEDRAKAALGDEGPKLGRILHPSPASPAANRGWAEAAEAGFAKYGISFEG